MRNKHPVVHTIATILGVRILAQQLPAPPSSNAQVKWTTWIGLALLCLLGLGLRLRLGVPLPLWLDEGIIWADCHLPLQDLFLWKFSQMPGPFYDFLARISIACFGYTELALRLPSIALGIANILLGFWLATRVSDRLTAFIFAAFLAVDPVLVLVDAEARMYSLWLLLVLAAFHVIVTILKSFDQPPAPLRLQLGPWALLGLLLALCFWAHPLAVYFWAAVGAAFVLVALRQPAESRGSALRVVGTGLAIAYAIAITLSTPGLLKMVAIALHRKNPLSSTTNDLFAVFQTIAASHFAVFFYLAAGVGLILFYRHKPDFGLHLLALVACAILAVVVGQRIHHVGERHLYPILLPLYLGLAYLLSSLARAANSLAPRAGPVVACIVLVSLLAYRTSQTIRRCESIVRGAGGVYAGAHLIQYVAEHQNPGDLVILLTPMLENRADFYHLQGKRLERTGNWWDRENPAFGYDLQSLETQSPDRVWLIIEPTWQKDYYQPERQLVAACGPLCRKAPLTDEEIQAILKEGVVRLSRDRIEGADCAEIFKDHNAPLRRLPE
jgi:hypothetical protein